MRKYLYPFIIILALTSIFSCENKRDDNGDLGGMWKLTRWEDNDRNVIATEDSRIFYCVHQKLIEFEDLSQKGSIFYSYFKQTADSLIIYHVVENSNPTHPSDTLVDISNIAKFGIPQDGRFHIDVLSNKNLILSGERGVLTFRKY